MIHDKLIITFVAELYDDLYKVGPCVMLYTFGVLQIILLRYVVVFAFYGRVCHAYSPIKPAKLSNSS